MLQSKNNAKMEPTGICVQELLALGTSLEVANLRDSSHTRICIHIRKCSCGFLLLLIPKIQEVHGYIFYSVYSRLQVGGAGRNSALSISTSVHVVFASPINSNPKLQV